MSEANKIVMKTNTLEGVDMSVNNLEMFTSVRIRWTKVSHAMTKRNGITFIGTKEQLLPGDIIQVGNLGLKYKVISLKKLEDKPQGYIYRIKRVDGANITSTDINNVLVGQKVQIVSNKTFQQIFEQHPEVPHIEICPVEIPDTEFCCPTPTPTAIVIPQPSCFLYNIVIPALTSGKLYYKDCAGTVVEDQVLLTKTEIQITICGLGGQTSNDIYLEGGEISFTQTINQC